MDAEKLLDAARENQAGSRGTETLRNVIATIHANNVNAEEDAVRVEDTYFKEDGGATLLIEFLESVESGRRSKDAMLLWSIAIADRVATRAEGWDSPDYTDAQRNYDVKVWTAASEQYWKKRWLYMNAEELVKTAREAGLFVDDDIGDYLDFSADSAT